MGSRSKFLASALLSGLAVFACSSDPTPPAEPACAGDVPSFRFAHGGDGHPDPFGAKAAGQARAGRIHDVGQIVQEPDAHHKVRLGDFVLANDKIALYVEAEGESDGYFPFGGEVLAIEPVGDDGRPKGVSAYGESVFMFGLQTVAPDKVTVIADGADGKPAIVRASGLLKAIPFLSTFRILAPEDYDFPAAIDFVLEPGADHVRLRVNIANTRLESVDLTSRQYLGFFNAYRGSTFSGPFGFAQAKGELPYVAWDVGDADYLVRAVSAPVRPEFNVGGFELFSVRGTSLEACEKKSYDYVDIVTGRPGLDGVLEAKRRTAGEGTWREVRGVLTEVGGGPLAGALVHATSPDGAFLTRAKTDASGAFVLHAPPGAIALTPTLQGWAVPPAVNVADGATTAPLSLPRRATIAVVARDAQTNEALPVRVQIVPVNAVAPPPENFGVTSEINGRLWQEFAVTGQTELPVVPGAHRVIVSRGYEYELISSDVTAEAGKVTTVTALLQRSVDTTGVMCADFHIHSAYSVDAGDAVEAKVKGAIADGLDIPVSSEHEFVIDFDPIITRLGLGKWAFGMPSSELTTFTWGHFGVVPIRPKPEAVNNGAVAWVGKQPAQIFQTVNALPEQPVLIVNHPSGDGFQAYFGAASFDRKTASGSPDLWSDAFAAIEVWNDSDFDANRERSVADWFALLNAGKTYWGVGNSDSHRQRTSPVGYPRTCLQIGHDDPRQLSPERVRDVLRSGAATVSGGLFMTVLGPGNVGPGGTSQAGSYKVTVASPSWMSATKLEVLVDGVSTRTLDLTPSAGAGPGKRFEATVDVAPADSRPRHWVVFHAKGDGDLAPLHPGRKPFAVSNPIFF